MKRYSIEQTAEYLAALESPKRPVWEEICQIDSCQAWVVKDTANDVICLQSYYTIVSIKMGDEILDLGRWSNTTSRHQSKFRCYV